MLDCNLDIVVGVDPCNRHRLLPLIPCGVRTRWRILFRSLISTTSPLSIILSYSWLYPLPRLDLRQHCAIRCLVRDQSASFHDWQLTLQDWYFEVASWLVDWLISLQVKGQHYLPSLIQQVIFQMTLDCLISA